MLPRWHILLGAIFTFFIWVFAPQTKLIYLVLVFLASFLIDFDHYLVSVVRTGKISLAESFNYHRVCGIQSGKDHARGIRKRGDFHFFHTLEFHVLIGLLGVLWVPFFYIFIGMVFHSLADLFWLMKKDFLYAREFFFFNWIRRNF